MGRRIELAAWPPPAMLGHCPPFKWHPLMLGPHLPVGQMRGLGTERVEDLPEVTQQQARAQSQDPSGPGHHCSFGYFCCIGSCPYGHNLQGDRGRLESLNRCRHLLRGYSVCTQCARPQLCALGVM